MAISNTLPGHRTLYICILLICFLHDASAFGSRGLRGAGAAAQEHRARHLLQPSQTQCARSWLGYQCTKLVCGKIRMHWSLGGPAPDGPGCFFSLNASQQVGAPDPSSQLLHIVLQTDLTGYVAASWPRDYDMVPADAVIGFTSEGASSVGAYAVEGMSMAYVKPDSNVQVMNTAAEANATALTICFTRNISQVGKAAGVAIRAAQDVRMHFVASSAPFPNQHKHSKDHQCGNVVFSLLQTPGGPDDGGWRPSNTTVDTATEDAIEAERLGYMRAHGALQFTGWIVLVPLGILAARHRWLFTPSGVVGLWFQVHRAVQLVAVVLVVAGFVLPWTTFNSIDSQMAQGMDHQSHMKGDTLLEAHETLGISLMTVLGLHVVVAVVRPKPDASWRWAWNLVHWWTGRGLALLAGINVMIGIALWRRASDGSGVEWIVPLVLFAAGWVGLAFWLERRAPADRGRDGGGGAGGTSILDGSPLSAGLSSSSQGKLDSPVGEVHMSRLGASYGGNGVPYNKL